MSQPRCVSSRFPSHARAIGLVIALVLVAAACGGDSDDSGTADARASEDVTTGCYIAQKGSSGNYTVTLEGASYAIQPSLGDCTFVLTDGSKLLVAAKGFSGTLTLESPSNPASDCTAGLHRFTSAELPGTTSKLTHPMGPGDEVEVVGYKGDYCAVMIGWAPDPGCVADSNDVSLDDTAIAFSVDNDSCYYKPATDTSVTFTAKVDGKIAWLLNPEPQVCKVDNRKTGTSQTFDTSNFGRASGQVRYGFVQPETGTSIAKDTQIVVSPSGSHSCRFQIKWSPT